MSMMDDVLLNARSVVDSVGNKAGKVIDRSKLRLAALDVRSELSKKYRLLGRVCYEANKSGKNYEAGIKKLQGEINELNEQLSKIKEMLVQTGDKVKCPDCGTYNAKGSVFCNRCGTKLPVTKADNDDEFTIEELLAYAEEDLDEDISDF